MVVKHVRSGDQVNVIIVSDGVTSHHPHKEQQKEAAKKACKILGVHEVILLDFPDQKLDNFPLLDVIKPISEQVKRIKPKIVYTHHFGDLNQDHRTVFDATMVAVRPLGENKVKRVLCYEVASSTEWGALSNYRSFTPNIFSNISDTIEIKLNALQEYKNTFRPEVLPFPHPRSIEATKIYAGYRGISAGVKFAEAFNLVRELL